MNKKSTTIVAVICAVAIIAVLCIAIVKVKNGKREPVPLARLTGITELSFHNGSEELVFIKASEGWSYKEDEGFPLNQQYLINMEETLADLSGIVAAKEAESLEEYGLAEPFYWVGAVTSDGTREKILIGNLASGNSCFAMREGDPAVYEIPTRLGEEAAMPLYLMIELERFPELTPDQIREFSLEKHGTTLHYTKKADGWYRDGEGGEEKVSDAKEAEAIAKAICELKNTDCVNYKVVDKQLSAYGLDKPLGVITYSYEKDGARGRVSLTVGSADAKGQYYYTKLEGSKQVNRIEKGLIETCLYTAAK